MKRKRKYKIPLRHIFLLELLYTVLVGAIIYSFNGNDFIKLSNIEMIITSVIIGSIATYIHIKKV